MKALAYVSNFRSFKILNMSLAQYRFSDLKGSENKIAFGQQKCQVITRSGNQRDWEALRTLPLKPPQTFP